ncbi:heat shock protein DnaJ, partial [Plenodomus tracheiphilus IPT5]
ASLGMASHYDTLGVQRSASVDEIRKAFRSLQLKYHPDKTNHLSRDVQNESEALSKQLNVAYETLSDPVARRKYD